MDFTDISADVHGKSSLLSRGTEAKEGFSSGAYLAGQMRDLLSVLERTPGYVDGSESKDCMEFSGYAKKVSKIRTKLKTYHFELRGIQLYYYSKKGDSSPKGIYTVSYSRVDKIAMRKEELEGMEPDYASYMEAQMTSNTIILYTPTRLHTLYFENQDQAKEFQKAITNNIKKVLGDAEFEAKESAAKSMEPLIKAESKDQFYLYKNTISLLVASGMISDETPLNSKSKVKEGYLHMRKDDSVTKGHSWKRYYFVLVGTTIYYYLSTSNNEYNGVINLKACNIDIDEAYCKAEKWVFRVQTPMRTFILRAKHDGSMKEWLKVIDKVCPAPSGEILWKKFDNMSVVMSEEDVKEKAEVVRGTKTLCVTTNGKGANHKLKNNTIYNIGRDSSNKIVVDDECVSRSHLKIEVTKDDRVIATDMGSSRGTKVNGTKITCKALKEGDTIEIGNSKMILEAK